MHKHQADAAMMDAETRRAEYELHLAEFNAQRHIQTTVRRGTLIKVYKHN
jgi:hypothetical protein